MFDLPIQHTNALSTNLDEQVTIISTISRRRWIRANNYTYNLLVDDWKISNSVNLLSIPEIEEVETLNELVNFIQKNKLSDFIVDCKKRIRQFFPESKIKKEIHHDFEESYTKLFLTINTPLSTKESFKQGRKS